jgi:hypothetical protein
MKGINTMNNLKWILPMVVLMFVLGGCPYKSDIPMDTTGRKVNPAMVGTWEPRSNSGGDKYVITKDNDFTYKIVKTTKNSTAPNIYKAYIVDLDGDAFLHVQDQGEMADKAFYIYKVSLNPGGDRATLYPVTDNITEKFATGEEMKAFIKKYKSLSFFYDKTTEEYIKD